MLVNRIEVFNFNYANTDADGACSLVSRAHQQRCGQVTALSLIMNPFFSRRALTFHAHRVLNRVSIYFQAPSVIGAPNDFQYVSVEADNTSPTR